MDFTDEVVGTRHAAPENIVRRACSTPPPPPPPPPPPCESGKRFRAIAFRTISLTPPVRSDPP